MIHSAFKLIKYVVPYETLIFSCIKIVIFKRKLRVVVVFLGAALRNSLIGTKTNITDANDKFIPGLSLK